MQQFVSPNVIIDLANAENRAIEVAIPFATDRTWLSTGPWSDEPNRTDLLCHTGLVQLSVLNVLTHPDNVSNNVSINMYVKAGDDFQFSVPRTPVVPYRTPVTRIFGTTGNQHSTKREVLETQGKGPFDETDEHVATTSVSSNVFIMI